MKLFVLCGKARSGKDTVCSIIRKHYKDKNVRTINLQFSSYIKEYAKKIGNWDGDETDKPRELLQQIGTDIIRKKIDPDFFIKRIIGDIKVYSYYFDVITISDARTKEEINSIKNEFDNVTVIKVERPNFDNGLSDLEKQHFTETDLDDFNDYDYKIVNDKKVEDLENKLVDMKVI